VKDTWASRDLPVLDATITLLEDSYMVTVSDIAERTGLDQAEVARALETLDPDYVDFRKTTTGGDPRFWYVHKATALARRETGQWPTPDTLIGSLAHALSEAAERETDPERKGLLTYSARLLGDTLRDIAVDTAAKLLYPGYGLAARQPEPASEASQPPPAAEVPQSAPAAQAAQSGPASASEPGQQPS
jgi:predicted transcriptional regulator